MEVGVLSSREDMEQHPKVTLDWALRSLERAIQKLGDGWAERRVRRQFHQVLLAVERDGRSDQPLVCNDEAKPSKARMLSRCGNRSIARTRNPPP
jgi:hypothetical protein